MSYFQSVTPALLNATPFHVCVMNVAEKDITYRPVIGFSPDRFWKTPKNLWLEYLI